jgi:ABC-type arginine/histidine transport system permease subunit
LVKLLEAMFQGSLVRFRSVFFLTCCSRFLALPVAFGRMSKNPMVSGW